MMKTKIAGAFLVLSLILVNIPYVLGNEPSSNTPPECHIISIIPDPVHCENPVNFTGKAYDVDQDPKYFWWDVDNDGNFETGPIYFPEEGWVYHTYTYTDGFTVPNDVNSVVYTVRLKVCDYENFDTKTELYNVTAYPVADADGPYFGNAGDMITFNGSGSYDPNGHVVNWTWDFGDGNLGYGEITNHSYIVGGDYTVNLTVTDNLSGTGYNLTTADINNPPDIPSDPNPYDGAPGVDVNAILSWTCSDPDDDELVFDVYFEKDDPTPDVLVSDHQSQTFYDPPGEMEYDTHYYWQIVAWDPYDASTTGPVWDFTTSSVPNNPPDTPSDPDPEDGATGVDVNADLGWTCSDPDDDDLVYDVYFEAEDPNPDELVSDDQTETTFDPGEMERGVTYYWQIIAKDEHGASTTGPIWSFTTKENQSPSPPIITGPNTGKPNTEYDFTFHTVDPDGDDVKFHIDWGDEDIETTSFTSSGSDLTVSHIWTKKGTYAIKSYAEDGFGALSDWSFPFLITIEKSKSISTPFLSFLQSHPNMFPVLCRLLHMLI